MRLRHMEESQQVKKLKNLKSIVLLGIKNSPTGQHSKEKILSFPKTRKKKASEAFSKSHV